MGERLHLPQCQTLQPYSRKGYKGIYREYLLQVYSPAWSSTAPSPPFQAIRSREVDDPF